MPTWATAPTIVPRACWADDPPPRRARAGRAPMECRVTETVAQLLAEHRSGETPVAETVARSYARLRAADDPAIFISLRDEAEVLAEAAELESGRRPDLPLYGIPVAIKDNIDVAGL